MELIPFNTRVKPHIRDTIWIYAKEEKTTFQKMAIEILELGILAKMGAKKDNKISKGGKKDEN